MIIEELYDALIEAGASEEKAKAASRAIANYESRFSSVERDLSILKWMVGLLIAITLMTLGSTIGVLFRLSAG